MICQHLTGLQKKFLEQKIQGVVRELQRPSENRMGPKKLVLFPVLSLFAIVLLGRIIK
jgi:hypothetical protein